MELECKRKDGSWHPCRISLSEGNTAIIVSFENCGEEEIESREEGLARLRFRSAFLQGGECSQLREGQCVLASRDASSSNLFFDAVVEKINKVRHSDRLACRCTFSLKWLPTHLKDQKISVPYSCIMRLSDKDIETHPAFEAFMASTNSRVVMESHAFISPVSENLFDVDVDGLLEKQVQEISVMAQGVECSKDVILGLHNANQKGFEIKKRRDPNSGRRVTRSKSKQETEAPIKETQHPQKEAKEKCGSLSFLSPLAARAALASLISTLPANGLPKKFPLAPERSIEEVDGIPSSSVASAFPASGHLKQAEKPPFTPNRLNYNSDTGRRVTVNPGSDKASSLNPVIPRRVTRSAVKREGVDLTADMQGKQDQKARGIEEGNTGLEDVVTPIKTENKKRRCISPSVSTATSTSIVSDTVSGCEGETCQDVESQIIPKKKKMVSRKPPTRFSPRLSQLDRDISQVNKGPA